MKLMFWLSALVTVYSYFLYAAVLALWPQRRELRRGEADWQPSVTLIITAYNEEGRIADKLNNALALDYPLDRLDIIVASDCSGDDTDRIVGDYAARGVRLVRADERKGKEYAQYCAIQQAENDILVFSDVATEMPRDALQLLVSYFADPSVGAVSSEDRFVSQDGSIAGEGAYVKYEMWLRRQESRLAGLVGLSGSFFAVRASVCEQWDIYSPSDFNTALNCARSGLIAVTAPDVLGFYKDIVDGKGEYQRKVRTVLRGMTALVRHPEVLNPRRFGLFALQLWSHKLMRWAVPWAMLMLLISSVALWQQGWIYQVALILQVAFYGAGLFSWLCSPVRSFGPLRIVFFFLQVNLALAQAFLKLISGKRIYVWQPSER
jgi:cellulose synthase/poly-beta-1,6-N-acetylglucosamine synthase-like glycosyltransferase